MDYKSNQDLFRNFNSWKTNTFTCDQYQRKQELQIQQIQRQERVQEYLSGQAERLFCAERAHGDAVSHRMGFPTSYSILPAAPPLSESPWFLDRYTHVHGRHNSLSPNTSLTSLSTLSSVDTHTPSELMSVYPFTPELTPVPSPVSSPMSTPVSTPLQTPVLSPELTPELSPVQTPELTPKLSPVQTPELSPELSPVQTPVLSPELITALSPELTPVLSPELTPGPSPELTPVPTPLPTPVPTPVPTPPPNLLKIKVLQKRLRSEPDRANISNGQSQRVQQTPCTAPRQLLLSSQTPTVVPKPPNHSQAQKACPGRTLRLARGDCQKKGTTECASEMSRQGSAMVCRPPTGLAPKTKEIRLGKSLSAAHKQGFSGKTNEHERQSTESDNRPLPNPEQSLMLAFEWLESKDWSKKIDGLKTFQILVRFHQNRILPKLHKICWVLIEEIKNLRSTVACAAINAMADLYVYLKRTIDPEVERTCQALLLRLAQSSTAFTKEQVNLALDALVENCNHKRVVTALLNTGLNNRCIAVRASTAEHLKQVLDKVGTDAVFSSEKGFTERFLIAVSKMAVDAAPDVRCFGLQILKDMVLHRDFSSLWENNVPQRGRHLLDKIFKMPKEQ